ncbi:hypothetical protein [Pseudoteredinibacter isoporae]|uniref:hypothetical protein n=1 Tax=Pseudoteredinibacter isoporae TaxID=570281 RepID=UPI003104FC29
MNRIAVISIMLSNLVAGILIGLSLYFTYLFHIDRESSFRFLSGLGVAHGFTFGLIPALYSFVLPLALKKQLSNIVFYFSISLLPLLLLSFGVYSLIEAEIGLMG